MKKLLTLSVLATTLVSTAVFALSSERGDAYKFGKSGGKNAAPATTFVVAKNAQSGVKQAFSIAQTLTDALAGHGNRAIKAVLMFDKAGHPSKAEIFLAKKVTADDIGPIQEAALASVQLANQQAGTLSFVGAAGKGNRLVTLTAISSVKDSDSTGTVTATLVDGGKKIVIQQVATDQAAAAKLVRAHAAAQLTDVKPSR